MKVKSPTDLNFGKDVLGKDMTGLHIIDNDPTCKVCDKMEVCGVLKAIIPLMNNWESKKPFEPDQLANICQYYARKYDQNL